MVIKVSEDELNLILWALNIAGAKDPKCDDLHDAIEFGDRCQGE